MALKIRLSRFGTKNEPHFRVIVTEERPGTVGKDPASGASVVYRHRMVAIVLGSADPFAEGLAVLQQGWGGYDQWLQSGRPVHDAKELLGTF